MTVRYKSYRTEYEKWLMENVALAVESVATQIWSHAKLNHPWQNKTGELEKSIRIRKEEVSRTLVHYSVRAGIGESTGIRAGSVGAGGSRKAYYAIYLELGTRKMRAYPFLRPALDKYRKVFAATIKKILASAKRKYGIR